MQHVSAVCHKTLPNTEQHGCAVCLRRTWRVLRQWPDHTGSLASNCTAPLQSGSGFSALPTSAPEGVA